MQARMQALYYNGKDNRSTLIDIRFSEQKSFDIYDHETGMLLEQVELKNTEIFHTIATKTITISLTKRPPFSYFTLKQEQLNEQWIDSFPQLQKYVLNSSLKQNHEHENHENHEHQNHNNNQTSAGLLSIFNIHHLKNSITFWIISILCFLFLSYQYLLPWGVEAIVSVIPIKYEKKLGDYISSIFQTQNQEWKESVIGKIHNHEKLSSTEKIQAKQVLDSFLQKHQVLEKSLNTFFAKYQWPSHYHINLFIPFSDELKNEEAKKQVNAFALPGGTIMIYPTLFQKLPNHETFLALIGHEITHIEQQHSLKAIARASSIGIISSSLFGDFTGLSSVIIDWATQASHAHYGQSLETESDVYAAYLLHFSGYSRQGLISLLTLLKDYEDSQKKLKDTSSKSNKSNILKNSWWGDFSRWYDELFASHPMLDERIQKIQTLQISHNDVNQRFQKKIKNSDANQFNDFSLYKQQQEWLALKQQFLHLNQDYERLSSFIEKKT